MAGSAFVTARAIRPIEALLGRAVDYAGLFPPAHLSMAEAVGNYAQYRDGADQWMLGRFVVPSSRLEEFDDAGAAILPRSAGGSWALSAVVGADVELDVRSVDRFNERHRDPERGAVHVDTLECRAKRSTEVMLMSPYLGMYDAYVEFPLSDDPAPYVDSLLKTGSKAKIRTGGVTPDAFPGPRQVIRFLRCCIEREVPFKATAGLHHPLRAEYPLTYAADAPRGVMYGFLNIFLASGFMWQGMEDGEALELLDERDPAAVRVTEDGIGWRGHTMDAVALRGSRLLTSGFGSCSFREPVTELRAMGML